MIKNRNTYFLTAYDMDNLLEKVDINQVITWVHVYCSCENCSQVEVHGTVRDSI